MANWPATLPKPLISGYSGQEGPSFIRSEVSQGPARQRKITVNPPQVRQISWRFTSAEMVEFRAFWKNDINLGSDWFTMDMNIGDGETNYEVRFIEPYADQILPGNKWQIQGRIEVRDPNA